jgi:diguanylate cyclase (GGDEF)-like protein/PAS domain S-box-containing protein
MTLIQSGLVYKMSKNSTAIHLLLLHESPDEAEQIVNALRNAGQAARATQVTDEEALVSQLKHHEWDLFLTRPEANGIIAKTAIAHIKRMEKDIPCIILANDNDSDYITEGLYNGATDVVPADETKRLILVIKRELRNLLERQARQKINITLKETEKRCHLLLDSSRDAITYVVDGMHIYANQSYLDMFGYDDPDEFDGMPIIDMIAGSDQHKFKKFLSSYDADNEKDTLSCKGLHTEGRELSFNMEFSPATYDGEPCTQIIIRTEVSDAELQEKLKAISRQDLLTGLYNRQYFIEQLDHSVENTLKGNASYALLYINLDHFGTVKSQVSIAGADVVLTDIASLLQQNIQQSHLLARFGEDVFTLLYAEGDSKKAVQYGKNLCQIIKDHLSEVQDRTIQVTASIGITMINNDVTPSTESVLTRAHFASDNVRKQPQKGNGVHLHTPEDDIDEHSEEGHKKKTTAQLQKAVDGGLFKILFQPIISLRGDSSEFYEVLLRMLDDKGHEVSPDNFLETATKNKLAEKIDRWVIIQSVKVLAARRKEWHDTHVIINLTAKTIVDQNFLPWLRVALKAARIPSDCLTFQVSEMDVKVHLKQAKQFTQGLKDLRCKVCLSRFSATEDSFNTLKHITVDYLKFDGSLLENISDEAARESLKEWVTTAHTDGKQTIMPLVESAGALSSLWQIGVNYIQGYYLQPPMEQMNYDFSHSEE